MSVSRLLFQIDYKDLIQMNGRSNIQSHPVTFEAIFTVNQLNNQMHCGIQKWRLKHMSEKHQFKI